MKLELAGDVYVPGDKSISHRALMLAAAAEGQSRLRGLLPGADCQSTAEVLRALGCAVPKLPADGSEIRVDGRGLDAWERPAVVLDCGNSGTTARLLLGLLAGRPITATLSGDASLRGRPMRRVTEPLARMGADFHELGESDRLPLTVTGGALQAGDHTSAKASAQVKSALLLAGFSGRVPVTVREPFQSRDHTERMLRSLGAHLVQDEADGGFTVHYDPHAGSLPPLDLRAPGDFSSAAFLLGLGSLADAGELRIRNVGVNPTRTGLLAVLARMGADVSEADVEERHGEPVADLVVRPSTLRGTTVGGDEIPAMVDEVPLLAVVAARAAGETRVTGASELRVKESDRIRAIVQNLRAVGVEAEELPDGLVVSGTEKPLRGRVVTEGDHRIAMAFGVLAALPRSEIEIDDPDCVAVSFPGFWQLLQKVAR